jgi:pilus assembly protein Flp/PilA
MTVFLRKATAFWNDESGVTAIEYGLIAALIGIAAIVGITAVGTELQALFTTVAGSL